MNNELRSGLLDMWSNETNQLILRRLSHVIAQSAAGGDWVELLPTLISRVQSSQNETEIISLLKLIEIIADYCPDDILTHIKILGNFLPPQFQSQNTSIQVSCAKATVACIVAIEDEGARNFFKPALQPIIEVLGSTLSRGDEVDATCIMDHLVEVAQIQPLFFKGAVDNIVAAMLSVASSNFLEFSTRSIALELMVTLTETAPALARRCPALVEHLVPLAMNIMLEVDEEDSEWAKGTYTEEPDDENYVVGEEAIERVAAGMGGRLVIPPVLSAIQQFIPVADWKKRRAAVAALCRLAEGCTNVR